MADIAGRLIEMADESLSWRDDATLREAAAEIRRLRAKYEPPVDTRERCPVHTFVAYEDCRCAALSSAQGPEEE